MSQKWEKLKSVFRVASGNFLEMYDFMVFGYFAESIAGAFFPSGNKYLSLMLSLSTFGAGFLMRPVGAVVLGSYIDRHGRRKGLLLTLGLMSIGTLTLTLTPSYHSIGWVAPMIVLIGRLLQGFSAGVELGGTSIYLAEISTPGKMGFYVSFQSASQQVAVVAASSVGYFLNKFLSPAEMTDYGWRIPLALGCAIVPFLFLVRRSLHETEVFEKRKHRNDSREHLAILKKNWPLVLTGLLLIAMSNASFYTITAYTPTYGSNALGLEPSVNLFVTLCVGLSNFLLLPLMGHLSDRFGRRPLLLLAALCTIATAYPAMSWLTRGISFERLLLVELWLSLLYAAYNGAVIVYLAEIMPMEVRTAGFSLAYSLANAIFGGFTPAICTFLIHRTENMAMPGVWLAFAGVCALSALAFERFRGGHRQLAGEAIAASL
jgi:MFS family permease